jgi:hypothetical protein
MFGPASRHAGPARSRATAVHSAMIRPSVRGGEKTATAPDLPRYLPLWRRAKNDYLLTNPTMRNAKAIVSSTTRQR